VTFDPVRIVKPTLLAQYRDKNVTIKRVDSRYLSAHGQRHNTTVVRIEERYFDPHGLVMISQSFANHRPV
jgi:hypothetical protein